MTKNTRNVSRLGIIVAAAVLFGEVAQAAETYSDWGSVRSIETGWVLDTMAVSHSATMVNPDGCRVTNAGYATNPADPGHNLFHTVTLSAFLNRKEVRFLISGCVFDKPRIIGVSIR